MSGYYPVLDHTTSLVEVTWWARLPFFTALHKVDLKGQRRISPVLGNSLQAKVLGGSSTSSHTCHLNFSQGEEPQGRPCSLWNHYYSDPSLVQKLYRTLCWWHKFEMLLCCSDLCTGHRPQNVEKQLVLQKPPCSGLTEQLLYDSSKMMLFPLKYPTEHFMQNVYRNHSKNYFKNLVGMCHTCKIKLVIVN